MYHSNRNLVRRGYKIVRRKSTGNKPHMTPKLSPEKTAGLRRPRRKKPYSYARLPCLLYPAQKKTTILKVLVHHVKQSTPTEEAEQY